jgi:hypothetical protein
VVEASTGENVVGAYTSLALDGNGVPRISYYVYNLGSNEGDLKYATRASGNWGTSFVDKTNDTGYYSSLALDSQGRPRISYYDATKADLRYAAWNGSSWNTDTLAGSGNVGRDTSIAIDRNDITHISYLDMDNGLLNEIYMKNGNWSTRNITALRDVGLASSLVLDKTDRPHISYYNDTTDDLKYATRAGAAWPVSIVADANSVGTYTSVAGRRQLAPYRLLRRDQRRSRTHLHGQAGKSRRWTPPGMSVPCLLVIDNQNYPDRALRRD